MWKATGKQPEELATAPKVPDDAVYLWELYWRVRGAEGMSLAELEAWCRLTGTHLRPAELELLMEMDAGNRDASHDRNREALNRRRNKRGAVGNVAP